MVPWRVSLGTFERLPPTRPRHSEPMEGMKRKCIGLFVILYQYVLIPRRSVFPSWVSTERRRGVERSSVVLACVFRLSEPSCWHHIAACLKRWIRYAAPRDIDVKRQHAQDLAAFLRSVRLGGPTAASSLWQVFRWLRARVTAQFDVEHFLVRPFRLHAPGHVQRQRDEFRPWEFVKKLICAASLTGCPHTLASFCIMSASACVRFRHMQRSVLVRDHGDWLEFSCAMGKSRALPQVCFEGFDLLAEIRPIVLGQLRAGAKFLWP